jgi:hypothetical protein
VQKITEDFLAQQPRVKSPDQLYLGRSLEVWLDRTDEARIAMEDEFISIEHLLLGLVDDDRLGKRLFKNLGCDRKKLEAAIKKVRGNQTVSDQNPEAKYASLQKYGRDLTESAKAGKLDPVIGRDDEIRRTIQILQRRGKNNPVLIGEPGVGKTAIVEGLAQQGKLMESYGAQTVYITDSAGYMLPNEVKARVHALRQVLKPETEIGFHGHHNLGMGIANSIAAIEEGATRIDGSIAGLGAGAGNTPLEVFAAVCERMGIETGCDLFKLMDIAEELITPMMDHMVRVDRSSLTLGFAGVYSTFLLHAERASKRFGVPARDILVELGRKKMIGGQEDMILDTAMTMAKERGIQFEESV